MLRDILACSTKGQVHLARPWKHFIGCTPEMIFPLSSLLHFAPCIFKSWRVFGPSKPKADKAHMASNYRKWPSSRGKENTGVTSVAQYRLWWGLTPKFETCPQCVYSQSISETFPKGFRWLTACNFFFFNLCAHWLSFERKQLRRVFGQLVPFAVLKEWGVYVSGVCVGGGVECACSAERGIVGRQILRQYPWTNTSAVFY